jgi:uncharacterized small protein (DUF1192 family)
MIPIEEAAYEALVKERDGLREQVAHLSSTGSQTMTEDAGRIALLEEEIARLRYERNNLRDALRLAFVLINNQKSYTFTLSEKERIYFLAALDEPKGAR